MHHLNLAGSLVHALEAWEVEVVEALGALEAPNPQRNASSELRLVQTTRTLCSDGFLDASACGMETVHILLLVILLSTLICVVGCLWWFTKDYEESRQGPLCPQLLVKQPGLNFKMVINLASTQPMLIESADGTVLCKVVVNWADKRIADGPAGIILTLGLQSPTGAPLAAVAIRSAKHKEDAVMLCRPGCIVFGFLDVPADPREEAAVFYRTGSKMLGLVEEQPCNLRACSYLGIQVGSVQIDGDTFIGQMVPELDAGLFFCSVIGRHVRHLVLSEKLVVPTKEFFLFAEPAPDHDEHPENKPRETRAEQSLCMSPRAGCIGTRDAD